MARVLSTAFCVALLAATAVAFALTEGAKTELSPIYGTKLVPQHTFSPTCNPKHCPYQAVNIDFRLRKKQHIEVWMERNGKRVSTIVAGRTFPKGEVMLQWDGTAGDGVTILPDGTYKPVIRFTGDHRTITLPNPIVLDTVPPSVTHVEHRVYTHISPDGDHRNDVFRVPYVLSEPAHAVLLVGSRQAGFTKSLKERGVLKWGGTVDGVLRPPGRYVLSIAAQDAAGNRSKPFPFAVVTIRYIALGRTEIAVTRNRRFAVFVLTDAQSISWLFDRGRGTQRSHTLRLRAPRKPGTYSLYVTASGHTARATVTVG